MLVYVLFKYEKIQEYCIIALKTSQYEQLAKKIVEKRRAFSKDFN